MELPEKKFVSRAGLKLDHALDEFQLDVTGFACADFGCNVGGFTDCLLQRGAAKVYAIDTGYGVLDYRLREDSRVGVMERTNALHAEPPPAPASPPAPAAARGSPAVDLVVIDLAWTPQRYAIPAALRWLRTEPRPSRSDSAAGDDGAPNRSFTVAAPNGSIITLVKPHYELDEDEKKTLLKEGRLDPIEAERVLHRVLERMPEWGAKPAKWTRSPITGGKSGRGSKGGGNVEFLALCEPV